MDKIIRGIQGITTRKEEEGDADLDQELLNLESAITLAAQNQHNSGWLAFAFNAVKRVLKRDKSLIGAFNETKEASTFIHYP